MEFSAMDALITAAASGLRARMESLDMLANNLANATSAGFKADREFYSTYLAPEALDGPEGTLPVAAPIVECRWTDFSQGTFIPTGNTLDFSLAGSGFFVVDTAQGPLYTRSGNFRMAKDGTIVSQSGEAVRGANGKAIKVDPNLPLDLDEMGALRQNGQEAGRFAVVDFANPNQLSKAGMTYFRYDSPDVPGLSKAKVEQGKLEGANFQPSEGAVRLVSVVRQFEMLQRAMTLGAEMNRRAVEEVARIRE